MLDTIFFYSFALMTLLGALLTRTRRNPVHCAIWLIVSLLGVAGLFLLQKAEFLFAVQIVLYVGGIMVLFLFVIMLVNLDESAKLRQFNHQWIAALLAALAVGAEGWYLLRRGLPDLPASLPDPTPGGNVERLADVLFSRYLLPFEVASILLLVAIVGSVVMAKKRI
jgi:NADH-quinone oxidoreductase subunit J